MPQPYSDDLRCKFLQAYEAGEGTLKELAKRFRVSFGFAKKIRKQQLQTGGMERPVQKRHGPVSRVTPGLQQLLRSWLRRQPDLTLLELQQRIQQGGGVWLEQFHSCCIPYPQWRKNACAFCGVMAARTWVIAGSSCSSTRAFMPRSSCFSLDQACSMGLKSGEYGGR